MAEVNRWGATETHDTTMLLQTHMQCQRCPVNGKQVQLSAIGTARRLMAEEGPLRLFRGIVASAAPLVVNQAH
jgi:hypothetical protein